MSPETDAPETGETILEFSTEASEELAEIVRRYPAKQAAVLPALWLAQREFGTIDRDAILCVARALDMPPAKVMGIHTFYTLYRREGDGEHVIHVCSTLSCALRGSERIFDHLSGRLGIGAGETTEDGRFTLRKAECIAACGVAPAIQVDLDYLGNVTTEDVDALVDALEAGEPIPDEVTGRAVAAGEEAEDG